MKTTRHTSLAVIVILVILIVLLTAAVETAPEVVTPPSSVTIFSGNTAEFTCHVRNAHYATWRLNGTIVGEHNTTNDLRYDANAHQKGTIVSGVSTTLTIKAKPKYTGLVIQCVTGDRQGTTEVTSDNATLMVQGLLDLVSDVKVEHGNDTIILSWRPPYSLNVTEMEPDIWYNIIITNITDDMPVPCSDCHNLTQPHYTFTTTNPSPCQKYNFTIISLNGAGEGGRSEPVEAFFRSVPCQVDGENVKMEKDMTRNSRDQSIKITLPPSECPGKPNEYIVYFEGVSSRCGSYRSERLTEENSVLRFTADNTELPPNCSYIAIIETINNFGRVNSTKFNISAAGKEDSTEHTSSIAVTPTPSGEPESEVQNTQSYVIIGVPVIAITIISITIAIVTIIVLVVIFRKEKQSMGGKEEEGIIDDGCGSDSNSSSTTSSPTKKKNLEHTEGVTYSELGPLHARSVKPLTDNEPPSQYATINFPNMLSTVPAEASDTQLTEPVIPEKPKIAHHDVNDAPSDEAPPLPPPYVPRGQEIQTTSETPFQQTTPLAEEKYFTKEGNVSAEQTSEQLMECGKMNIVEGENGKLLFATDGYTPPLNDNDEDAIRGKYGMKNTIERSFEPYTKSSQRFVSNCGRPGNEEVNAKSRGPMFINSPCGVPVPESYKRPSQLVAFNTYLNAQLTVLPPNEIPPSAQVHTPEQHSCGPVMQVTEEEMPPTAKYCFTPFSPKKLENDPKSDTCEIDCLKSFESSDSYEMEFDCMQSSQSSPSEDEDTQETEPSVAKMEGGQENESSLPEDKDAQETESNLPKDEDAQETESSLPKMGGGQMKISDDVPDTPRTQLHTSGAARSSGVPRNLVTNQILSLSGKGEASYLLENILGLTATVLTVCSVVKIINSKYATWDRGRTVLNCLWNGCSYIHCN